MPNDLATALVSGQNNQAMMDPAMAGIMPQLQLAQALQQQGMSTAPAAPAQAWGRLAQTLAGVKVGNDAQNDLNALNSNATAAMGKIFPPGTVIGDGLQSDSPLVRMHSMQAAAKAMVLNSVGETMGPEQRRVFPGTPKAGGGVVAQGDPSLAGATEAAKNPALVGRAVATAAGELPYKPIKRVIEGPNGPEMTERPAVELGPRPVQTIPVRPPVPRPAVAETGLAPGAAKQQDRAPALPATAPGAQAANFDDRFGAAGVRGEPVKTPEFQGRTKMFEGADEALGKEIGEHITGGGKVAREKLNALDTIESAMRTEGGKGIVTGPHAESVLRLRETLDGMGIKTDWIKRGMPESEIITKMNAQLASASAKAMTGRPTQFEFASWQKNNPGLSTSKEGSLALIDVLRQQAKNDIDLGKLAQDKKNWENWPGTVDKFYEGHGLTNPLTGKPMRDEIAAARGAAPGAPAKPSGPQPGTVVGGHRFKGGDPNKAESWEAMK